MFVGHALLAFAAAVLVAEWRGWPTRRAFALGITVGTFAALPDVDVLYAAFALDPGQLVSGTTVRPEEFWGTAHGVHRSMTHSLVAAAVAGPAFALWTIGRDSDGRLALTDRRAIATSVAALGALGTLVGASVFTSGIVGGLVMAAFALVGLLAATVARSYLELSPRIVGLAATAGIASHPWGDLLTGEPPRLLYPVDAQLLTGRVALSADPTLHLLGTFAIELAVVAFAAAVVARHAGYAPIRLVDRRAGFGALYGAAAVVMAPPTIHLSYHFVFSILVVGAVCGSIRRSRADAYSWLALHWRLFGGVEATLSTVFTALAGIAVALCSYTALYLVVG